MPVAAPAQTARYSVLQAELASGDLTAIGVLLEDPASDALYVRLRRDWERLAQEDDDREVLSELAGDLSAKANQMGADALLRYLEDTLSTTIRITDREAVEVQDFEHGLNRLYRRHVESNVVPFRTHLPRYSLRAAAGRFLENEPVSEQGWIEAPEDLLLTEHMFVAQIQGHSMEPMIPDGSLCVFRAGVAASRRGRLVLVEDRETSGNNRYAVKRYRSEKAVREEEDTWRHTRIRLESLNPDYPSWDLDPDEERYQILAEFVRVLE